MRASRVDRYGEVCRQIAAARLCLDPLERERKAIQDDMQQWFSQADPEHVETVDGKLYSVEIGQRKIERKVNNRALVKRIGRKLFDQLATVALGVVDRMVPEAEEIGIVSSARTGKRVIGDPILLAPPAAAQRAA